MSCQPYGIADSLESCIEKWYYNENKQVCCKFSASWPLSNKKKTITMTIYEKSMVTFTLLRRLYRILLIFTCVFKQQNMKTSNVFLLHLKSRKIFSNRNKFDERYARNWFKRLCCSFYSWYMYICTLMSHLLCNPPPPQLRQCLALYAVAEGWLFFEMLLLIHYNNGSFVDIVQTSHVRSNRWYDAT